MFCKNDALPIGGGEIQAVGSLLLGQIAEVSGYYRYRKGVIRSEEYSCRQGCSFLQGFDDNLLAVQEPVGG